MIMPKYSRVASGMNVDSLYGVTSIAADYSAVSAVAAKALTFPEILLWLRAASALCTFLASDESPRDS